ncbi:hypothetical protein, partial [Brucella melitensis]|uniref:hypothetical protein n=1 Tax=Brucella melitensis TaxID=29459 RepID=UPI003D2E59B1
RKKRLSEAPERRFLSMARPGKRLAKNFTMNMRNFWKTCLTAGKTEIKNQEPYRTVQGGGNDT